MTNDLKCKDTGMNCKFEIKNASSIDEVMRVMAVHVKEAHKMDSMTPDLANKIKEKISR
jgi:predicted small metal-binding protein